MAQLTLGDRTCGVIFVSGRIWMFFASSCASPRAKHVPIKESILVHDTLWLDGLMKPCCDGPLYKQLEHVSFPRSGAHDVYISLISVQLADFLSCLGNRCWSSKNVSFSFEINKNNLISYQFQSSYLETRHSLFFKNPLWELFFLSSNEIRTQ